jgi:hypothetical protein
VTLATALISDGPLLLQEARRCVRELRGWIPRAVVS